MYLNVNIVLLIVLYHWITICTCQIAKGKRLSDQSSITSSYDCSVLIPDKNDLNSPIPYTTTSDLQSTSFLSRNENNQLTNTHLNIKHNSSFKLACPVGKNKKNKCGEVEVKCVKGSLEYKGELFDIEDVKCQDPKMNSPNGNEQYNEEGKCIRYNIETLISKKRRGRKDCFFWVPYRDYNMPIPFKANTTNLEMLQPDHNGNLWVAHNSYLKLSCVNRTFQEPIEPGTHDITIKCLNRTLLEYSGKPYQFDLMRCNRVPNPTMIMLKKTCQDMTHKVVTMGFETESGFLGLYRVCMDLLHKDSLYAWYTVTSPYFNNRQVSNVRPVFITTNVYGEMNVNAMYKSQGVTISELLKSETLAEKYINMSDGKSFLSRGHLVSRTEFNYAFEQDATFFYENTAPMWQEFNEGIWRDVEKFFRRKLSRGYERHLIITGTYGQCTLPNSEDEETPLYLCLPSSIKVPLFVWRMDYDLDKKTGVVFIGLNHPYVPMDDKRLIICETTECPGPLLRTSTTKALLYCCTKESFEKVYGEFDPFVYEQFR